MWKRKNAHRTKKVFIISVMMVLAAACVFAGGGSEKKAAETSVTMAMTGTWATLNPFAISISETSGIAQSLIYLDMAKVLPTGEVMPLLLESFESSADGKTWTVKIRKGILWHDGRPITADDLVWTFKTFSKQETVRTSNASGSRQNFSALAGTNERGLEVSPGSIVVKKIDDMTAQWELKVQMSAAAMFYDMRSTQILPKHVLENMKPEDYLSSDYWYTKPIGSGPYKFESLVEGERIEYTKFDNFVLGTPKFDRFVLRVVPQSNLLSGLMSGDIDILVGGQYGTLPVVDVDLARRQANLLVESVPAFMYQYISLNNSGKLSDVRVRKAINYAIDKKRIVNEILKGEGTVACLPYASSHPYFNKALSPELDVYDPEKAKALLKEAGWDPNTELSFGTRSDDAFRASEGVLVQQDLAAVGIKTIIRQYDNQTLMSMLMNGELELATMGSAGAIEPHEPWNLYNPDGQYCFALLKDYTYADFFTRGKNGLDFAQRAKEYYGLQEYIIKEMPYSYVCNPNILMAYNKTKIGNVNTIDMCNSYRAYWDWESK
jgi:peptide/nickel transport system substrate-binding protein